MHQQQWLVEMVTSERKIVSKSVRLLNCSSCNGQSFTGKAAPASGVDGRGKITLKNSVHINSKNHNFGKA
jgi:hypothetical protein